MSRIPREPNWSPTEPPALAQVGIDTVCESEEFADGDICRRTFAEHDIPELTEQGDVAESVTGLPGESGAFFRNGPEKLFRIALKPLKQALVSRQPL